MTALVIGARTDSSTSAVSARRFAARVSTHDVLFVAGVYKTGTSLAVDLCVRAGYRDPSGETNPGERGYGSSLTRYVTHECKVLRQVNDRLLTRHDRVARVRRASPESYLLEWGCPIVLKDPRFIFTLPRWISAARRLGHEPGVIFSHRPRDELVTAWEVAPFTSDLLMQNRLGAYLASFQERLAWCLRAGVPHIVISLEELRRIDRAWPPLTWARRL